MKTHSIEWSPLSAADGRVVLNPAERLNGLLCLASKALLSIGLALAVVVGVAWLVNMPGAVLYLQAVTWAAGFVFLGLAVESETAELSILGLASGVALPALALFSSANDVEPLIVASTLAAAWIAAAILRR